MTHKRRLSDRLALAVALIAALGLGGLLLNMPGHLGRFRDDFASGFAGFGVVAVLAFIVVRLILPRLDARYQALPAAALTGVLSLGLAAAALDTWLVAVDINALGKAPRVVEGHELRAAWQAPYGTRPLGILVAAVLEAGGADPVAYYGDAIAPGASSPNWLPIQVQLRLADDTRVQAAGITRRKDAVGWPECGDRLRQHCLRAGDTVVLWADPGALRDAASGEERLALTDTRVIFHGGMAAFEARFLGPGKATARLFGWIAFALIPLSLIPAMFGIRRALWLRRHGADRAPPGGKWIR